MNNDKYSLSKYFLFFLIPFESIGILSIFFIMICKSQVDLFEH